MTAESPGTSGPRLLVTVLLWTLAVATAAVLWLAHQDPVRWTALVQAVWELAWELGFWALLFVVLAILVWPTSVPWIRHRFRRFRERAGVDQQPLTEALGRLAHFDNAPDHLTAARVYAALGQHAQAVPHLVKAVGLEPDNAQALYFLGRSISLAGDPGNAQRFLAEAVRRDPELGFGEALHDLTDAAWRTGDDALVESTGAEHERRFGPEPRVDLLRAKAAARQRRSDDARRLVRRAVRPPKVGDGKGSNKAESTELRLARARARVLSWRLGRGDTLDEEQA